MAAKEQAAGVVPAAMMAKLLGVSERRLQQLRKEQILPAGGHGKYELVGSVQGYIKYLKEAANRDSNELENAKLRKWNADADAKELEVAIARGEAVPIQPVIELWGKITTEVRTNLLALPSRVAPKLTDTMTTAEKADFISGELNKALEGFTRTEIIPEKTKAN